MIHLRRLAPRDAAPMLEWMHDADTVEHMHARFAAMTEADCLRFIEAAAKDRPDVHRAVADEADRYLGTVSLKGVDDAARSAEFAIAMHPCTRAAARPAKPCRRSCTTVLRRWACRRFSGAWMCRTGAPAAFMKSRGIHPAARSRMKTVCSGTKFWPGKEFLACSNQSQCTDFFYNLAPYVDQTLESVVSQQTDFPVEILCADDGSDDGTIEKLRSWEERYPDSVRVFVMDRIPGAKYEANERIKRMNAIRGRLFYEAKGQYVCYLDGDDFYTDVHKLQKQADILDADTEHKYVGCGHNGCYYWRAPARPNPSRSRCAPAA